MCSSPAIAVGSSGSVADGLVAGALSTSAGLVGTTGGAGETVVAGMMAGAVSGGPIGVAVWGGATGGAGVVSGSVVAGGSVAFGGSLWRPGVWLICALRHSAAAAAGNWRG